MKDCSNCLNKSESLLVCPECSRFYKPGVVIDKPLKDLWFRIPNRKGDDFIWESE